MTDDQIRLYAVARGVIPGHVTLRTIAEPVQGQEGNVLYTLVLEPPEGKTRWFAILGSALASVDDERLAVEIKAAVG